MPRESSRNCRAAAPAFAQRGSTAAARRDAPLQQHLSPRLGEWQSALLVDKLHRYRDQPAPPTPGNILAAMPEGTSESAGWTGIEGGGKLANGLLAVVGRR